MRRLRVTTLLSAAFLALGGCSAEPSTVQPDTIIALERAALDRWGKGDPQGYLELYATDVTYFDPMQERRIDGAAEMQRLYGPIKGRVNVPSSEMLAPKVQQRGDVALLTFNLLSHGRTPKGDTITIRWNSTEVYGRSHGKWMIIHSHWSLTKAMPYVPTG